MARKALTTSQEILNYVLYGRVLTFSQLGDVLKAAFQAPTVAIVPDPVKDVITHFPSPLYDSLLYPQNYPWVGLMPNEHTISGKVRKTHYKYFTSVRSAINLSKTTDNFSVLDYSTTIKASKVAYTLMENNTLSPGLLKSADIMLLIPMPTAWHANMVPKLCALLEKGTSKNIDPQQNIFFPSRWATWRFSGFISAADFTRLFNHSLSAVFEAIHRGNNFSLADVHLCANTDLYASTNNYPATSTATLPLTPRSNKAYIERLNVLEKDALQRFPTYIIDTIDHPHIVNDDPYMSVITSRWPTIHYQSSTGGLRPPQSTYTVPAIIDLQYRLSPPVAEKCQALVKAYTQFYMETCYFPPYTTCYWKVSFLRMLDIVQYIPSTASTPSTFTPIPDTKALREKLFVNLAEPPYTEVYFPSFAAAHLYTQIYALTHQPVYLDIIRSLD